MKKYLFISVLLIIVLFAFALWGALSVKVNESQVSKISVIGHFVAFRPLDPCGDGVMVEYEYVLVDEWKDLVLNELRCSIDKRDVWSYLVQDCDDAFYVDFTNDACVLIEFVDGSRSRYLLRSRYRDSGLFIQSLARDRMFEIGLGRGTGFIAHSCELVNKVLCGPKPDWLVISGGRFPNAETPEEIMR